MRTMYFKLFDPREACETAFCELNDTTPAYSLQETPPAGDHLAVVPAEGAEVALQTLRRIARLGGNQGLMARAALDKLGEPCCPGGVG